MANQATIHELQPREGWDISPIHDIEQQLDAVRKRYAKVPDFDTSEGYQAGKKAIQELTKLRTGTDKARKALTQPHRDFVDQVNQLGKSLISEVEQIEKPFREAKAEVDEREAREKERRIRDLRNKLEREVTSYLDSTVGLGSEGIRAALEEVEQLDSRGYYDITVEAEDEIARVTRTLRDRLEYAAEAERLAAEREELEREKAELARLRAETAPPASPAEAPAPVNDEAGDAWSEVLDDLYQYAGLDASQAVEVIRAIQAGEIRHTTFNI